MNFLLTAGLETHIELSTESKLFCFCKTTFGAEPNTLCCPVCMGHPGTLPVLNRQAVYYAVMAGLALNCRISCVSRMVRKNYFYPDLPKAYQISQLSEPLCSDGYLQLSNGKKIRINRIQLEEDAGKLIHRENEIYADYNRCGVPLIEIVSEPDFESIEEAREYIEKLRIIMRYIGISDCRMQEGSMRFDVNVSVRGEDDTKLGTRTEIKNMNSVSNMAKAIEYEYNRQCRILQEGGRVEQLTLRFDEVSGTTIPMRSKEDAHDYRFFSEPDIPPIVLSDEEIGEISRNMPILLDEKFRSYREDYGISKTDASQLSKYRRVSQFFDEIKDKVQSPSFAANLIISRIFAVFETENEKEDFNLMITADQFCELITMAEKGSISKNLAKTTLDKMLVSGKSVSSYISEEDTKILSGEELNALCKKAVEENTSAVSDYKNGKEKALTALLGAVMRYSKGKADPVSAKEKLIEILKN